MINLFKYIKTIFISILLTSLFTTSIVFGQALLESKVEVSCKNQDVFSEINCIKGNGTYSEEFSGPVGTTCYCTYPTQASTTPEAAPTGLINMAAILDVILNVMYIIIWPLLAITGLALDNSLVYGDIFGMTDMLYKFWRMMMNISYIVLTLMILWDIVDAVRSGKAETELPKKAINWFLVGILIPATRWIVSALVDLSTILIYQVGGIPLTILGTQDNLNIPILSQNSVFNLADVSSSTTDDKGGYRFSNTFSCGASTVYLPCLLENGKIEQLKRDEYVSGSIAKYKEKEKEIKAGSGFCVLTPTQLMQIQFDLDTTNKDNQEQVRTLLLSGTTQMGAMGCNTIKDLIDKSKSMVGPLYSIYGGLLNFTSLNVTSSGKSTSAEVILFLIKSIVGLLLIFPLVALCLTSLARIGILWMTIAFSPLLVLYHYFGKNSVAKGLGDGMKFRAFGGFINFEPGIKGIVKLIFQPVLVVLALGIAIVFLSATNQMLNKQSGDKGLMAAIGIEIDSVEENGDKYQRFKIKNNETQASEIRIKEFPGVYGTDIFFDYFTWILTNIFGIMVMRQLMFAALRSSDMTKGIVNSVEDFGTKYLASRPVFGGLSYDSVKSVASGVVGEVTGYLAKDSSEGAAKELLQRTKERMPRSPEGAINNGNFNIKDLNAQTPEQVSENLAKGLIATAGQGNSFSASSSDSPAFRELKNKAGIAGSDITTMINEPKFREHMSISDKGREFLTRTMSDEKLRKGLVGQSTSKATDLANNYKEAIVKMRGGSNILSGVKVGDDGITSSLYMENDRVRSYTTEKKGEVYSVSRIDYYRDNDPAIRDILNGYKIDDHSKIISKLSVPTFDATKNQPGLVYNTSTNKFEFRTKEEEQARHDTENKPPAPVTPPAKPAPPATQANLGATPPGTPPIAG